MDDKNRDEQRRRQQEQWRRDFGFRDDDDDEPNNNNTELQPPIPPISRDYRGYSRHGRGGANTRSASRTWKQQ